MASSDPVASELQDGVSSAVAAFMKALLSREESSKTDVRRAVQAERDAHRERDELRRERDALLVEKMAWKNEIEAVRLETERWKVVAEKGEWMNNNHVETIERLKQEALEWKDRYLRSDEEQQRLAVRNEELVAQQLYVAHRSSNYLQEPLTPRSQGPQVASGSSVPASAAAAGQYVPGGYASDGEAIIISHGRRASAGRPGEAGAPVHTHSARSKTSARGSGRHQPLSSASAGAASSSKGVASAAVRAPTVKTKVIRKTRVIMDGPLVKEESVDSAPLSPAEPGDVQETSSLSLGEEEDENESANEAPSRRSAGKGKAAVRNARVGSRRRKWSEDRRIYDEDSASASGSGSGSEAEETYMPPEPTRSRVHDEEDEDDELNLGGAKKPQEIYGSAQVVGRNPPTARRAQTQPTKNVGGSGYGSGTGRKRNSPYPGISTTAGKKVRRR